MILGVIELLVILGMIVLLFGGKKLPKLANALGRVPGELERGTKDSEFEG